MYLRNILFSQEEKKFINKMKIREKIKAIDKWAFVAIIN